jgi:ABC-2 type transport system permease protein
MPDSLPLLAAQARYQLGLLARTPRALSTGLALPVILLLVSDTRHGHLPAGQVAGLATFGVTMSAWTTHGIGLVAAREAGVLKRWWATPLPRWCHLAGRIVATVLLATLAGTLTVTAGAVAFGTPIGPAALAVFVLGAFACAAACTAVTGFVPNVASAFPVLGLTYLPVLLVSGALGASGALPCWVVTLSRYLPVRPTSDAATSALDGHGIPPADVLVLAAWVVAGLLAALVTFRWEPSRPRRRARPAIRIVGS